MIVLVRNYQNKALNNNNTSNSNNNKLKKSLHLIQSLKKIDKLKKLNLWIIIQLMLIEINNIKLNQKSSNNYQCLVKILIWFIKSLFLIHHYKKLKALNKVLNNH